MKNSIFLAVLIILCPGNAGLCLNDWDIPERMSRVKNRPFVVAFVERDYQTGNNMTVTMIGKAAREFWI